VPADIEPPALARLIDFAERPRTQSWSLRAALVRYAQPQPRRVEAVLELVRRVESAIHGHTKLIAGEGAVLWEALEDDAAPTSHAARAIGPVVELLRAARELDRLGDVLAAWAVDRAGERPDDAVDQVTADVAQRLDALGVPREERQGPPRQRA
jgi:hypothetical protein